MPEKSTFDYIDNDPLVPVTLINPASNKKAKVIAYLDTGSETVVIPRELWLKLELEMLYRSNVCAVGRPQGAQPLMDFHGYEIRAYPRHLCNLCSITGAGYLSLFKY